MNKEQLDQAAIEASHSGNIKRNIYDGYCTLAAEEAFKKGAQWMEKQQEDIINNFFGREAVLAILNEYERQGRHLRKLGQSRQEYIEEWMNLNYPSKTTEQ